MVSVFDVAAYILSKKGQMTTVKLQKLVYYCQAWSLVWDENALFHEPIRAWANGPAVHELFSAHKGRYQVDLTDIPQGDPSRLTQTQKETIDAVLSHYGNKSAQWLVDLTHLEEPWKIARLGCEPGAWCDNEITLGSMLEYYSGL